MATVCCACGAPLSGDLKGTSDVYWRHCCEAQGVLKPRADIQRGIASWFRTWQPNLDAATALKRAALYTWVEAGFRTVLARGIQWVA